MASREPPALLARLRIAAALLEAAAALGVAPVLTTPADLACPLRPRVGR